MEDLYIHFVTAVKEGMQRSDLSRVPRKYLSPKGNYSRTDKIITAARKLGYSKGLDFGSGMSFCTILGKLSGMEIVGLDIPDVGGMKRNKRGRRPSGPSPYLSMQVSLQELGYPMVIADTNKFPWDFKDDEFDFIVAWYSLTKQHMDRDEWSVEQRLSEMSRITKKPGCWFVHPKSHVNVARRSGCVPKEIKISDRRPSGWR